MIEAKTLRALAKHSGFKPASIFRMQPTEILDMLTEKHPDIKEWDETKAQAVIKEILAKPKESEPVKEEKPVVEAKTAPKKTEAKSKAKSTKSKAKTTEKSAAKSATTKTQTKRDVPTRTRKKSKFPVPVANVGAASSEDIAILQETVKNLEAHVTNLTRMVDDISMFMTWFHNVRVDPNEPIEHLGTVDWTACIEDQVK